MPPKFYWIAIFFSVMQMSCGHSSSPTTPMGTSPPRAPRVEQPAMVTAPASSPRVEQPATTEDDQDSHPYLGVVIGPTKVTMPGIKNPSEDLDPRVIICCIMPGSPASASRLVDFDCVLSVNGVSVRSVDAFLHEFERCSPGARLQLVVTGDRFLEHAPEAPGGFKVKKEAVEVILGHRPCKTKRSVDMFGRTAI